MPIKYLKGDLLAQITKRFSYILHSCNCQGSWGGGFAYQLSIKYPQATKLYQYHCHSFEGRDLVGTSCVIPSDDGMFQIICLFTSFGHGGVHDSPEKIVKATEKALSHLKESNLVAKGETISLPLINAGIFGVPWEETEAVLEKFQDEWEFNVYVL